jgi:hypothetical protein
MRIISDFQDYYDYIGHQHPDNKIVYQRQCQAYAYVGSPQEYTLIGPHKTDVVNTFGKLEWAKIHVCGTAHPLMWQNGQANYDPEAMYDVLQTIRADNRLVAKTYGILKTDFWGNTKYWFVANNGGTPTNVNQALGAPVVLQVGSGTFYTNCRLASINYSRILPPTDVFMHIYNFLAPKEVEPDTNPDNMNRYEAKGFDKKNSFRNVK